jgi:hypothetical protein
MGVFIFSKHLAGIGFAVSAIWPSILLIPSFVGNPAD